MKVYLLVFLTLISSFAFAQYEAEEFKAALLEAKYGAMLIYNGKINSFSLKFVSQSFKPTDKSNLVNVDNILMQSSITPFTQKLDFNNLDKETQKSLLSGWKTYEKNWVEEQLNIELKEKEEFMDIAGKQFLYWIYDMPKDNDPEAVAKQVYLVTICFDQMLILNAPVDKGKTESIIKDKLVTVAETLTLNPNQTQDLKKLYYELKK